MLAVCIVENKIDQFDPQRKQNVTLLLEILFHVIVPEHFFFGTLSAILKRLPVPRFGPVSNKKSNRIFNFLYLFSPVFFLSQLKEYFSFYWLLRIPLYSLFFQNSALFISLYLLFSVFHIIQIFSFFKILYILFASYLEYIVLTSFCLFS